MVLKKNPGMKIIMNLKLNTMFITPINRYLIEKYISKIKKQ